MNKSTAIKIYLLSVLTIFLTSWISTTLLFFYMNPESNKTISLSTMWVASFLTLSSFFTIITYFIKRIYFRWEIYVHHLNSSLRQAIIASTFVIWNIIFYSTWVFNTKTVLLFFVALIFIELIFQAMSD